MSGLWFAIVSASALLVIFAYLYVKERERYLAIWAGAWGLWVVRYAYGLASGAETPRMPRPLAMTLRVAQIR